MFYVIFKLNKCDHTHVARLTAAENNESFGDELFFAPYRTAENALILATLLVSNILSVGEIYRAHMFRKSIAQ